MSHNTPAAVGQNAGRVLYARGGDHCKLQIADRRSFPLPPSALRLGISLTEVLIAMGILTVGLLGVAAIFPVAGFYMQKGEVADRSSAIAQAAFNEVVSRGMLDPENWLMFRPLTPPPGTPNGNLMRWTYSQRFAGGLRDEVVAQSMQADPLVRNRNLNTRFGYVYVVDPLGANSSPQNPANPTSRQQIPIAQRLPINAELGNYSNGHWWPWNPIGTAPAEARWPVMRVSLEQPAGEFQPWPMTQVAADKLFRSSDDLALDVPPQADRPSMQVMSKVDVDNDGDQDVLARQSQGNYSWIATVTPPSSEARNALAIDPSAFEFEVAVAVFYKRVLDEALDTNRGERLTIAKVVSTGLSGGELLIEKKSSDTATDPFVGLKTGNWVPVCGPHPASTRDNPRFVFRWYRILSIEKESDVVSNPNTQRLVTLRGPQWPWQPAANLTTNELSNNLCLSIIPNVVAVHSKTIKVGGRSSWSVQ